MKTETVTYIIAVLFILFLLVYYVREVCKANCYFNRKVYIVLKIVLWDYFPLLLAVGIYYYLLSMRSDVGNTIGYTHRCFGSRDDNNVIYNSYAFMVGSTVLISSSVCIYLVTTMRHFSRNIGSNTVSNTIFVILCMLTMFANFGLAFHIYDVIILQKELSTAADNLNYYELISVLSVVSFFLIDCSILYSTKAIPSKPRELATFIKSTKFAIWNVDIASLLAVSFIFYLDTTSLHYSENYINYVFITSGIAL